MLTIFKNAAVFTAKAILFPVAFLCVGEELKADDLAIAAGPGIDPTVSFREFGRAFDTLQPGETLNVIDAVGGNIIVDITLPTEARYRLPKFKRKFAIDDIMAVRTYLAESNSVGNHADYPAILSTIGKLRDMSGGSLHVLMLGGGLHMDKRDPAISMLDGAGDIQIPGDGFLNGTLLLSGYGRSARDVTALSGVTLHICPTLPEMSAYEQERLGRFWTHYADQRGGGLVTFDADLSLCTSRFQKRLTKTLTVTPLDPDAKPVMERIHQNGFIEQVTKSERADEDQIRDTELEDYRRDIADLEKDLSFYRDKSKRLDDELAGMRSVLDSARKLDGVTEFSRFQKVAHPTRKNTDIHTGVSYDTNAFPAYKYAWCYMHLSGTYGGTVQVTIAGQQPGKSIVWSNVSDSLLSSVNLSRKDYEAARLSCRLPGEQA